MTSKKNCWNTGWDYIQSHGQKTAPKLKTINQKWAFAAVQIYSMSPAGP